MKGGNLASLFFLWITAGWMTPAYLAAQQTALPPEVVHYADTVVYNGKILTADAQFTIAEAVAIRDGRFLAVGPTNRILPMAGPKTKRIDLKGKTVTPGLFDMHRDSMGGGLMRHWTDKFLKDEPPWTTKEEMVAGIKRVVAKAKAGDPVMFTRIGFDPVKRESGTAGFICGSMSLQELDAITPNNPVFFMSGINTSTMAMNSKAAEVVKSLLPVAGLSPYQKVVSTPFLKPNDPCVARGNLDVDGTLNPGQWAGNWYVWWYEPSEMEPVLSKYRVIQQEWNKDGVVMGRGHMGVPQFNGAKRLWELRELTVRYRMPFPVIPQFSGHSVQVPPEMAEQLFRSWGNMSKIGDNMLRVVGMRIPAVGGNQNSGNTWTIDPKIRPYPDMAGNPAPYGGWLEEQEAMEQGSKETFRGREALIQACRFGWDTASDHTLGDRSYREVIKAYEECRRTQVVKLPSQRNTTGHTPMHRPEDIALAGRLGIRSNVSTGHLLGTELEPTLMQYGTERVDQWGHMKTFIKEGIHPALETTFWLAKGRTAFLMVGKAITRKDDLYGRVWNAPEALTRQEALWAGTIWGAEQLAEEREIGSIEGGKEGDLLIIDKDYMAIPTDDIENIKPLLTMVGGKVVYEVAGAL